MSGDRAPGAVVVRASDPEVRLQGLRTALSLAMGDRPAALYLVGAGVAVLAEAPDTEAARCLDALPDAGVDIYVETPAESAAVEPPAKGARPMSRSRMLAELAQAEFQQSF